MTSTKGQRVERVLAFTMGSCSLVLVLLGALGCSKPPVAERMTVAGTNMTVSGIVVEHVDAPPYTYLRLKTADGLVWAAIPLRDVRTGGNVTVTRAAGVRNFKTSGGKQLDLVVFGVLL